LPYKCNLQRYNEELQERKENVGVNANVFLTEEEYSAAAARRGVPVAVACDESFEGGDDVPVAVLVDEQDDDEEEDEDEEGEEEEEEEEEGEEEGENTDCSRWGSAG
jgi:hypothetical protein